MSYLIEKLRNLGLYNYLDNEIVKEVITGYTLMTDNKQEKILVLIKNNENSWKTQWFQTKAIKLNTPELPIEYIFKTKV